MKKIYLVMALVVAINFSIAQTKSSGTITLNSLMTLKIDKNTTTSIVIITLTGPTDRWFGIGFNAFGAMTNGTDCLYYASSLVDSKITGESTPTTDTTNEWTVSSNTTFGTTRTLILTRNFVGGTGDYTFVYNDNALNIIWAYGTGLAISQHSSTSRGSTALGFTLGVEDFTSLDNITIAPNPSKGIVTITKNNQITISKVTVFDINAKVLKEVDSDLNLEAIQIDLSKFSKGVYFIEIANETDKVVRKIVKE